MARIPDDKREAIAADIRAGKARNQIALDHGVSAGTVTNIAGEFGLTEAFDRSATKKATEAKAVDHKARLVAIAGKAAGVAEDVLASFGEMDASDWAKVSPYSRGLIVGIMADKARELAPEDSGAGQIASLLGDLLGGMKAKHGDAPPE